MKIDDLSPSVRVFYDQIDKGKLKNAVNFIKGMGNGTLVYYQQEITWPDTEFLTDIYVEVSLTGNGWNTEARKYGRVFNRSLHEAIVFASGEIV
ncbi:MAG: hypothetical protein GY928_33935 [Colwellia sp.]|nr:hypothetical protein [Colwellia sp.]